MNILDQELTLKSNGCLNPMIRPENVRTLMDKFGWSEEDILYRMSYTLGDERIKQLLNNKASIEEIVRHFYLRKKYTYAGVKVGDSLANTPLQVLGEAKGKIPMDRETFIKAEGLSDMILSVRKYSEKWNDFDPSKVHSALRAFNLVRYYNTNNPNNLNQEIFEHYWNFSDTILIKFRLRHDSVTKYCDVKESYLKVHDLTEDRFIKMAEQFKRITNSDSLSIEREEVCYYTNVTAVFWWD